MTAKELARLYRVRESLVRTEFRKSGRGLGISAVKYARERMIALIYAFPIPRTRSGKPKWKRTKRMRDGTRHEMVDDFTVRVFNIMPYAKRRHELGKKGEEVTYPAHWHDELEETFREIVTDTYRLTIQAILKARQR